MMFNLFKKKPIKIYCEDCKYFEYYGDAFPQWSKCRNKDNVGSEYRLITRNKFVECRKGRGVFGKCGKKAKYFEAKE